MAKVVFRPSGKTIECEVGDNLLEVARRADVFIEAPCNGSKSCGKCKVKLLTGEVNQEVSSHLTDEDKANGYILACCTTIIGDIEVLTNSSLDMAMRGMKVEGGDKAKDKALFDKAVEIAENHNIKLENNINTIFYPIILWIMQIRKTHIFIDIDPYFNQIKTQWFLLLYNSW